MAEQGYTLTITRNWEHSRFDPCTYSYVVKDGNGHVLIDWYGTFRWAIRWKARQIARRHAKWAGTARGERLSL